MDNSETRKRLSEVDNSLFISIKEIRPNTFYYLAEDNNDKFKAGSGVFLCEGETVGTTHDVAFLVFQYKVEQHPLALLDSSIQVISHNDLYTDSIEEGKTILPLHLSHLNQLYLLGLHKCAEESYRYRRVINADRNFNLEVLDQELVEPDKWNTYEKHILPPKDGMTYEDINRLMGIYVDSMEFLRDYSFFTEHFKVVEFNSYDGKRYHTAPKLHYVTSIPEFYLGERRMPSGTIIKRLNPTEVRALAQHEINNFNEDDIVVAWVLGNDYGLEVLDKELQGNFINIGDLKNENFPAVKIYNHNRFCDGKEYLHLDELFSGNYRGAYFGPHRLIFEFTNKKCSLVYHDIENDKTLRIPLEFKQSRVIHLDPLIQQKVDDFLHRTKAKSSSDIKKSSIFK